VILIWQHHQIALSHGANRSRASIEQQLELMQAGRVRVEEDIGAGWVDKTTDAIERAKERLAELSELLTEAGKDTVVKPDCL
jgi:methionine synthase II (cobalamin-independent)